MVQQFTLRIPQPCHERWEDMQPTACGTFCAACSKEVTDFSGMSNEELLGFFHRMNGEQLCGRFRNDQPGVHIIYIHERVFRLRIPLWQKILAVALVCFSQLLFERVEAQVVGLPVQHPTTVTNKPHKKIFKKKHKKRARVIYEVLDISKSKFIMGLFRPIIEEVPPLYHFPYPNADTLPHVDAHTRYPETPLPKENNNIIPPPLLFKHEEPITLRSVKKQ